MVRHPEASAEVRNGWLWTAALGGPIAWALHILLAYPLVPPSCARQIVWPLVAISMLSAAGAAGAIGLALWLRKETARAPTVRERARFMADLALLMGVLFLVIILAETVPILFGDPCIGFGKATEVLSAWGGEILGTRGAWAARLPVDGPGALFSSWTWDPLVLGAILLASGVYGLGRRRRRRRGGVGPAVRFGAGVLVWAVAASPPFERLADALLWGHMTQHLLLTLVAAPLLAGGAFGRVALAALPAGPRARIGRWLAAPRGRAAADVLLHPLVAAGLHAGALWLWHQPVAYEAALDSRPLHALEHASFLGTAALFWASVLRARRRRRLVLWGVLGLFLNGVASAVLGVLLTVAPTLWYPSYAATFHAGGLTPLEDQQLAGLLMWVPGQVLYLVMTLVLCARWLERPGAEAPICAPPFGPPAEGIR